MTAVNPVALTKVFGTDGTPGSFYFPEVVQPVLDEHCVKSECHNSSHESLNLTGGEKFWANDLSDGAENNAYRYWTQSYWNLSDNKYVHCDAMFGRASAVSPRRLGSPRSGVITKLLGGHNDVPPEAIRVIAAWIDLGRPHSGTYTDDMKEEHKTKYLERLERRRRQEEFEAKNIAEFIDSGGYNHPDYRLFVVEDSGDVPIRRGIIREKDKQSAARVAAASKFSVRFLRKESMLAFNLPCEGKIRLLDLQGRQILSEAFSKDAYLESVKKTVKVNLPAGTYIAKFKGATVNTEQIVSVL
jgi:hypothetical protein